MLADAESKTASTANCPIITKKVRHELIGESKQHYFRRSRVYMSTKVLLQHSLTMQLGAELGKFVYKILMMKFFNELCGPYTERHCTAFNIDLLSQMIAKMARRIEKLDETQPDQLDDDYSRFFRKTIERSQQVIKTIRHKIDAQIRKIQQNDEHRLIKPMKRLDFESAVRHEIPVLNGYLNERIANAGNDDDDGDVNLIDCQIKSYRRHFSGPQWPSAAEAIVDINAKADSANNKEHDGGLERRLFWIDFENRVLYTDDLADKSPELMREWALQYLKYAEQTYDDDQLLKSRMLLVYLKLIEVLDRRLCTDTRFALLPSHGSCVNPQIFDALLLPQRIDMRIADDLEQYFIERNENARDPGLIDERHVSESSFSVKYAKRNGPMLAICKRIMERDAENVKEKTTEWEQHQQQVGDLREEIKTLQPCQMILGKKFCTTYTCARCRKDQEIQNVKIEVYEHLLPDKEYEQLAIAFELQIPRAIACLRDILYGFAKLFGGTSEKMSFKDWIDRDEIREHVLFLSTTSNQSVRLGSTVHCTPKKYHVDQVLDTFIVSNTSNCVFHADQKPMPSKIASETIKNVCTPFKLCGEYRALQWTLDGTGHTENDVLAQQSKCPESLSISEYKNFGTLRADGHRLQLRKLYAMIETEALSFEKESVLMLIMQTLWECGIKGDRTPHVQQGIRESHIDFLNQEFCTKLLESLEAYTKRQENNWMHPFKLLMVTLIAVRIFEMNNEPHTHALNDKVVDLLLNIRAIIYDWIERIEQAIREIKTPDEDAERQLRLKLIYVAEIGCLTFFIHSKHNHFDMVLQPRYFENQTAPQQWLHFIITLKSNLQVYARNEQQLPANLRMFLRVIELIGIGLEATMKEMILDDRQQIYESVRMQWPRSNYGEFQSVDFNPEFNEILTVIAIVDDARQMVTIDIITGSFLVNGLPLSRLPNYILESEVYQWFFGDLAFEVQPDNQKSFSTLKKYNDCLYEFKKLDDNIIIIERSDNGIERELIHFGKLKGLFVDFYRYH